ncbi:hypothetical protein JCM10207_006871 [Rhodosporidiobolus poonsookiae]
MTASGWINDINIFASGKTLEKAVHTLQLRIPRAKAWSALHSSLFEPQKSSAVTFTPPGKDKLPAAPPLVLCGVPVPYATSMTMLGTELDEHLATYPSPLHLALHAFPGLLPPSLAIKPLVLHPVAPWAPSPRVSLVVAPSKEAAVEEHDRRVAALPADRVLAYTDRSLLEGSAGAGALVLGVVSAPFSPAPTPSQYLRLALRAHALALTTTYHALQLTVLTDFSALNAAKARFGVHPAGRCDSCGADKTRDHYLYACPANDNLRTRLKRQIGARRLPCPPILLNTTTFARPLLRYIIATGRFLTLHQTVEDVEDAAADARSRRTAQERAT